MRDWAEESLLKEPDLLVKNLDLANRCLYHISMLATQDVWDIEVPEEDRRTPRERLIADAHAISLLQLMFAGRAAAGEHEAELPRTVDAIAEGAVGFGHMVVMARTADALAASPAFNEERLL